jgi:hypothetical protein
MTFHLSVCCNGLCTNICVSACRWAHWRIRRVLTLKHFILYSLLVVLCMLSPLLIAYLCPVRRPSEPTDPSHDLAKPPVSPLIFYCIDNGAQPRNIGVCIARSYSHDRMCQSSIVWLYLMYCMIILFGIKMFVYFLKSKNVCCFVLVNCVMCCVIFLGIRFKFLITNHGLQGHWRRNVATCIWR